MEPSFIAEIIDEIIENACLNDTTIGINPDSADQSDINESSDEKSDFGGFFIYPSSDDEELTDGSENVMPSKENQSGSENSDEESNDLTKFSVTNVKVSDNDVLNDLISSDKESNVLTNDLVANEKVSDDDVLNDKMSNDKMLNSNPKTPALQNDQDNSSSSMERIENRPTTILGGDFYTTEFLRSKGFGINCYSNRRVVANLTLMSTQLHVCSIVCFGFPTQVTENELIPLFQKFGQVYKLRIIKTGYVFVTYTTGEDADKAIKALDRRKVHGHLITVKREKSGRLFVKPIPIKATKAEVASKIQSITKGHVKVQLFNDLENDSIHRGFCYLEFEDHQRAVIAKKLLSNTLVFGKRLTVDWPDRNYDWPQTHTLYITNVRPGLDSADIRKYFSVYGEISEVKKMDNFASVQFLNPEDAKSAANQIDKRQLGNENVDIMFTKLEERENKMLGSDKQHGTTKKPAYGSHTLYIRNIRSDLNTSELRKIFNVYGDVRFIGKNDDVVAVQFLDFNDCTRAHQVDKRLLGNENVKISFIKPVPKVEGISDASDTVYLTNVQYGEDLRALFSVYGEVIQIDKSGSSASLKFLNPNDSKRAAREIDKSKLGTMVKISLVKPTTKSENSVDEESNTLFIKNLRAEITNSDLRKIFSVYGELKEIDKNDNFASIRFRDGNCAGQAARDIDKTLLGDENVKIALGKPNSKTPKTIVDASYSLYLQNLRSDLDTSDLRKFFSVYGEVEEIEKKGNFATIQFRNVKDCKYAAIEISKSLLGGENVKISLSPPKCEKTVVDAGGLLFLSNLRSDLKTTDLRKHFSVYGEVVKVGRNGNFASIRFRNVDDSKRAALYIDKKLLGDGDVKILFEKPSFESEGTLADASDTLYLTNLRHGLHSSDLRKCFAHYGKGLVIDKNDNTATIRFKNLKQSKAAIKIDKKLLGNENVEISFVKSAPKF